MSVNSDMCKCKIILDKIETTPSGFEKHTSGYEDDYVEEEEIFMAIYQVNQIFLKDKYNYIDTTHIGISYRGNYGKEKFELNNFIPNYRIYPYEQMRAFKILSITDNKKYLIFNLKEVPYYGL